MTNKRKADRSYKSTDHARKLLAGLITVGGMMEKSFQQRSSMPLNGRIENLDKYFVAGYFKPLGKLHKCFFNCREALGRVNFFDSSVCAEIKQSLHGFWTALARHLGSTKLATEFLLLVEELLDLSKKNLAYKEGAEVQQQLRNKALGVFESVCNLAKEVEMSLSHPPQMVPNNAVVRRDGMVGNDAPPGTSNGFTPEDRRRLQRIERASVYNDTTPEAQHKAQTRRQQVKYGASLYRPTTKYERGFSYIRAAKAAIDHDRFRNAQGAYSASETKSLAQAIRRHLNDV